MDISKLPKGLVGGFYDTSLRTCVSRSAEEAIPFGFPVMEGTDQENQVKRFNGGISNEMLGVTVCSAVDVTRTYYSATYTQGYYPTHSTVTVMREGKMWAPIYGVQTISVGDTAYIDTLFDRITNTKVANQTVPVGKFLTAGTTTGVGELFGLELIPGYTEEVFLRSEDEADIKTSNTDLKNNKKSKK